MCFSQVTFSGILQNKITHDVLPFANVYIKNSTRGVISDVNGKFKITIENKSADTLIISYIGYESKRLLIKDLSHDSDYTYEINPSAIVLEEATILAISPKELLGETIKNLEQNYITTASMQRSILKQHSIIGASFSRNVDAYVEVYNPSYIKKHRQEVRVKLISSEIKTKPNPVFDSIGFLYLYNLFDEISLGGRLKQLYSLADKFPVKRIEGKIPIGDYTAYKLVFEQSVNSNSEKKVTRFIIYIEEKSKAVISLFMSSDRGYGPDKEIVVYETNDSLMDRLPIYSNASYSYRPYKDKWILVTAGLKLNVRYSIKSTATKKVSRNLVQENNIELITTETLLDVKAMPKSSACLNLDKDIFKQIKKR